MSSFVEESVNLLLRGMINNIVGINEYSIPAKENQPRPSDAYCSVDIMSIISIGWDVTELEDRIEDPDIDNTITGLRKIMISVQFYRDEAFDNAHKVHIGLLRNSSMELFESSNLDFITRSDVRDISEPLENGWENRAQLDIWLSTTVSDNEIIRSIETVTITGEFQTRGISIPIETKV